MKDLALFFEEDSYCCHCGEKFNIEAITPEFEIYKETQEMLEIDLQEFINNVQP